MQDTLFFFFIKFKTPPYRQRFLEYVTQCHSNKVMVKLVRFHQFMSFSQSFKNRNLFFCSPYFILVFSGKKKKKLWIYKQRKTL